MSKLPLKFIPNNKKSVKALGALTLSYYTAYSVSVNKAGAKPKVPYGGFYAVRPKRTNI